MPEDQAVVGFAQEARSKAEVLLTHSTSSLRPVDALDQTMLQAFNHYLQTEGVAALEIEKLEAVPESFHRQMADQFDSRVLASTATSFNTGADAEARVQSRPRNQHLADWMRALYEYYAKREHKIPYAGENLRLWKQEIFAGPNGKPITRVVEVDHVDPQDYAILGVNGVLGMHGAAANLEGFFGQMTQLLNGELKGFAPGSGKQLTLYAVTFPDDHRIRYAQEIPAMNASPETYLSPMVKDFSRRVILPLLGLREGEAPLSLADLKGRMRRLNFFLNSYGSCIGKEVRNALCEWLQEQGYQNAVIRQGLAEIYALAIHPVSRLDDHHPCGNFSSLYVVSRTDQQAKSRMDASAFVPEGTEPPALIPISENELMVWLDHPTQNIHWENARTAMPTPSTASPPSIVATQSNIKSGHSMLLATESYDYRDEGGVLHHYRPAYIANSLRSVVAATVVPKDLSQTLNAQPLGDLTEGKIEPIPRSHVLEEAMRRFREGRQAQQKT